VTATRLSPDAAPAYGIDRTSPLKITVDGATYQGFQGDSIASALLAGGRNSCARSMYLGRPRGLMASWQEEANALVTVASRTSGHSDESMLSSTLTFATDGLAANHVSGQGVLDPKKDEALYDRKNVHADVVVVGAGPAGLAAAREAAKSGARTYLIDDRPLPGGSLRDTRDEQIDETDAVAWAEATVSRLTGAEEFTYLPRTALIGSYDSNYLVAVQQRTDHLTEVPAGVSRLRTWHIRAAQVVLATGAHERPLVFADNDRPGIMLASAVRSYLNRYGVAAGSKVTVATTNDSAYATVADLVASGVDVVAVADSRPEATAYSASVAAATGVPVTYSAVPSATEGGADGAITSVTFASIDTEGHLTGSTEVHETDLLAVSGGFSPVVHLHTQRQGQVSWNQDIAAFVPSARVKDQAVVGAAAGTHDTAGALAAGALAGHEAARAAGFSAPLVTPSGTATEAQATVSPVWLVPGRGEPSDWRTHFVDLQRDQTVHDVARATGAGMRSVEHVKRYTSVGTAADQGRTSGVNVAGVVAQLLGVGGPDAVGTSKQRAPFAAVPFAALAGRRRGDLFDVNRLGAIHPWHVEQGAVFEDVGQWVRPRYYPQGEETMDEAVLRECAAVRESVGVPGRLHVGQDRDPWRGRGGLHQPRLHQRLPEAEGRHGPLRRHVLPGRHDLRRRRDHAHRRRPLPHDHHVRWRREGPGLARGNCTRPSGRRWTSSSPPSRSSGPPSVWPDPSPGPSWRRWPRTWTCRRTRSRSWPSVRPPWPPGSPPASAASPSPVNSPSRSTWTRSTG
jgi:sarcosine oxidase subunit alpha